MVSTGSGVEKATRNSESPTPDDRVSEELWYHLGRLPSKAVRRGVKEVQTLTGIRMARFPDKNQKRNERAASRCSERLRLSRWLLRRLLL
jgi:hypothetical protein